jgi:predicted AAA+ superfamily ATPase
VIERARSLERLATAVRRVPVTALLGPRQCGKTTLARAFARGRDAVVYDLESVPDLRRLQNPELVLGAERGLVILDEIQARPELFAVLRVLADRPGSKARFLVLGSASPDIVRGASETLAGRVEFVELSGFDLGETGGSAWAKLWLRGGLPRSFLARSNADSLAWRDGFVRTFLERDVPQLGIGVPAAAMRRFWTMLAHYHGQTWNASALGRSMGLSDKTVRGYLDVLTGTFMVRQLQPWHANVGKRQVRSPKVYLRDSGLLHSLLEIRDRRLLLGHPQSGASFEGFVIEQVLQAVSPLSAYFWGTHGGGELGLFFVLDGRRHGVEVKLSETPSATRSMWTSIRDLSLDHLWVVYPGRRSYQVREDVTVWPVEDVGALPDAMRKVRSRRRRVRPTAPAGRTPRSG